MTYILSFPMHEVRRIDDGQRWCFRCRKVREFVRIVTAPTLDPNRPLGDQTGAYYGPSTHIECAECGEVDGDFFPGTWREWTS